MSQSRQLTAIVFTDIVGYTALMGGDEQKAFDLLKKNREVHLEVIQRYEGRLIKELGDGMLASFPTVSAALDASIELQRAAAGTSDLSLRIGIDYGEIIFENQDLFGEAVNIASRIQTLGIPGSVLFSKKVNDEVANKSIYRTTSLGNFDFKNVKNRTEVFALTNSGFPVPKRNQMEGKLKEKNKSSVLYFLILTGFIAIIFSYYLYQSTTSKSGSLNKSIAVLPFVNMSEDQGQEYFCDGMMEEILNQLSKINDLKVSSRTSSMLYRGSKLTLKEIAKALGVTTILEGSVRKSADKIRITIQLIDALTDKHLWSETYERDFKEVFLIQSEVANKVAENLAANLTPLEKAKIEKSPTSNMEAYNLYLKGNYELQKVTPEALAIGLQMMNEAIKLDPQFAQPHLGIAYYYGLATDFYLAPNLAMPQVKIAAQTAIRMDSALAPAHTWLGMYDLWYAWNWGQANEEFQKSISLDPKGYSANFFYSWYLLSQGKQMEAKKTGLSSVSIEPMSPEARTFYAMQFYYSRDFDQALTQLKQVEDLDPNYPFMHHFRSLCYLTQGKKDPAIEAMKKAHELFAAPWSLARVAYVHARNGEIKQAKEILSVLSNQPDSVYVPSDVIASVYVALHNFDQAFQYLEKAINERAGWMIFIKLDPIWDPIRKDPRYLHILQKMNL